MVAISTSLSVGPSEFCALRGKSGTEAKKPQHVPQHEWIGVAYPSLAYAPAYHTPAILIASVFEFASHIAKMKKWLGALRDLK